MQQVSNSDFKRYYEDDGGGLSLVEALHLVPLLFIRAIKGYAIYICKVERKGQPTGDL